jgi:argininosuccinate synthase
VRFDVSIRSLDGKLKIIAPIRDLGLSREKELEQLKAWGIDFPAKAKKYSINQGILGTTIGGGETHQSWSSIPEEAWVATVSAENSPAQAEEVVISFEAGLPVALNGSPCSGYQALNELNRIAAANGVGRGVHLGDTVLGIKGRIAFEAPGALTLINAHRELEKLVLTKWQSMVKEQVCQTYSMLLHEGQYFNPVMRDIEALLDSSQKMVAGEVRVRLHRGQVTVEGVRSPFSLMDARATYGEGAKLWDGVAANGFCLISGVQSMLAGGRRSE